MWAETWRGSRGGYWCFFIKDPGAFETRRARQERICRTTPSNVAFTDSERIIGDAAKNQVAMSPTNMVSDANA